MVLLDEIKDSRRKNGFSGRIVALDPVLINFLQDDVDAQGVKVFTCCLLPQGAPLPGPGSRDSWCHAINVSRANVSEPGFQVGMIISSKLSSS